MFSLWNRVNAVFFYAVTALFLAAVASSLTTLWFTPSPLVHTLKVTSVTSLKQVRETRFSKEAVDRAFLHFDMDADLTGVWNWNVKQLFVYVTASYVSPSGTSNEVVIWDAIVENSTSSLLKLTGAYGDYPLFGRAADLRGRPITLSLAWDVMPITGYLYRSSKSGGRVRMPEQYCSNAGECNVTAIGDGKRREGAGRAGGKVGGSTVGAEL